MSRMSRRDFLGGRFGRSADPFPSGAEEGRPIAPGKAACAVSFEAEASGVWAETGGLSLEGGTQCGGMPGGLALPPEFTPALLRAEAGRLGLDAERLTPDELAAAVMRAMYARAPEGAGHTG